MRVGEGGGGGGLHWKRNKKKNHVESGEERADGEGEVGFGIFTVRFSEWVKVPPAAEAAL